MRTVPGMMEHLLEIDAEIKDALITLTQALGLRSHLIETEEGEMKEDIVLDGALVASILQTAKGKKLLSRSLGLLSPEQK